MILGQIDARIRRALCIMREIYLLYMYINTSVRGCEASHVCVVYCEAFFKEVIFIVSPIKCYSDTYTLFLLLVMYCILFTNIRMKMKKISDFIQSILEFIIRIQCQLSSSIASVPFVLFLYGSACACAMGAVSVGCYGLWLWAHCGLW